ncbi:helix-turn-helix domain-containing protein [Luteolibacter luteus]|uniref:Helix-turn-helix domain-containing protein n=1 Tax=Luteolibacter luteus TaxID=2728835 RepID=A0A858REP1_9BACT|nr:helix-turn-helix domain-containing protein [Luteolibacter luteus]QJE95018.1 helix-turn-helix domain-containing protein [Luteolibacter luteus]
MRREAIPAVGLGDYRGSELRAEGFVAVPYQESRAWNPTLLAPHYHDFFQVSLILGEALLMHDFREQRVHGNTLFFLSPGQVHAAISGGETDGTILSFTREFFDAGAAGSPSLLLDLPFFYAPDFAPWMEVPDRALEDVRRVFREIQNEFDQARPGASEIVRALLRILLVKASRWRAEGDASLPSSRSSALARDFQLLVERHFREWQALEPYARELGVTNNHLNDVIRETTGTPAGEHIRKRRLLDAKRLLLYSGLSVSEIGFRLGFKDPSYFARFFRRYQEQTPAEFREEIREKYQKDPA